MPTRQEIANEIIAPRQDDVRRAYLADLSAFTKRDTLIYATAFSSKNLPQIPGFLVSITLEDIQGFMAAIHGLKNKNLDLIIHSPGGSLEAADQIVQYLREKFDHIRAIVPQNAMSAATMLACACDEIIMGKHSAIGPIDPQITIPNASGHFTAPAQAILDEFEQAKREIKADPATGPLWAAKIQTYPHGLLNICQQTIRRSIDKVAEWLSTRMFKNDADGQAKAKEIAAWLGNAQEHQTHGKPIGYKMAQEKGLKIELLEKEGNQELQEKILSVYHATALTFETTECMKLVENHKGKGWYLLAKPPR